MTSNKAFPYVRPSAITLREETEEYLSSDDPTVVRQKTKQWEAEYVGPTFNHDGTFATAVGPSLVIRRTGSTAEEAETNLVNAILSEGYEFRK